ncbi:BTAD domain-containing putative transcriptional regulator [Streptomyces longispororuber]|uniref:BTAD domain-containing putative transcriptional regulator n=1 Tax=Streptomyces longispororuber TaxID=68230 RepID=UPI0036F68BCF
MLLLGGIPWVLWRYIGWPLPDHVPTGEEITTVLVSPVSTSFLLDALACLLWSAWTFFVADVLRAMGQATRGITWAPRRATKGPVHGMAAALVGAVILALLPYRSPQLATAGRERPASISMSLGGVRTVPPAEGADEDGAHPAGGDTRAVVVGPPRDGVHDSLWRIAERYLGDGRRWPEIYTLNRGRPQPDGRTLTHPGLIRPGWVLRLPEPRTDPDESLPSAPDERPPAPSPTPSPSSASPEPTPPGASTAPSHHPPSREHDDKEVAPGLDLPSGAFVGTGLALAVAAAAAVVLRRRRIRYRPGSGERRDVHLAPVVRALRAASTELTTDVDDSGEPTVLSAGAGDHGDGRRPVHEAPEGRHVIGVRESQALVWDLARSRGLGLAGPGALDAARSLLISILAEGVSAAHGGMKLVIPAPDAERLLGAEAVHDSRLRLLRIAADTAGALQMLEAELLTRTRLSKGDDHRSGDEACEVVLIATPSPADERRLQAVLDSGSSVGVCGILLDRWDPGGTLHIGTDGSVVAASPLYEDVFVGARLFTLPAVDAHDLFDLLAEAAENPEETEHSEYAATPDARGRPPCEPATTPASEGAAVPQGSTAQPRHAEFSTQPALRLIAFGHVRLTYQPAGSGDNVEITQALAPKQREVLAFLALHKEGVRREVLTATIWPDAPRERPYNSLHATLSHLRRALRLATHDVITDITLHTGSRYELDPACVAVDVWEFAQAVHTSRGSAADDGTREECLRRATRLYVGDFAAELTAGWIEAPREALRRDYLDAVSTLVRMRSHTDPREALDLLEQARELDPYNEAIYRDIARMQARLGLSDAVSRTFDLLRRALAELGEEPSQRTTDLYEALRRGRSGSGRDWRVQQQDVGQPDSG